MNFDTSTDYRDKRVDIILTWSGSESHDLAAFFRKWLLDVLPSIKPWISSEDIAKGKRWFDELMGELSRAKAVLVFVTPSNVRSPWIYFEVSGIAAKIEGGVVYPYLFDVDGKQVQDTPLGQFQWTEATKADTWKLILSINQRLDNVHSETLLEGNFNSQWPKLKRQIGNSLENLSPISEDVIEVEPSIEEQLSDEARTLLLEGSLDSNGRVVFLAMRGGRILAANGKNMLREEDTPRVAALWKASLEELVSFELLNPVGYKGEIFEVSKKGYEIADLIKSRNPRAPQGPETRTAGGTGEHFWVPLVVLDQCFPAFEDEIKSTRGSAKRPETRTHLVFGVFNNETRPCFIRLF